PSQLAEDSGRGVDLAEPANVVRPHARTGDQERHRIARMDHFPRGGRRMIAGDTDDRAVDWQPRVQRVVERLDDGALDERVLRMARGVRRFLVDEDEAVARAELRFDE